MGSTRAEGRAVGAVPRVEADLVAAAAALRWARPDLTAELAAHVLEEASVAGQQGRWLAAAGWAVHARAATGDGRDTACAVMAALPRWGSDVLAAPAAHRLRVELAMVAAGAGQVEFARRLLAEVHVHDSDPELAADVLCAQARCAVEDAPDEVGGALDAADAAWARVGGSAGELGGASVALIRAVVERRGGRPAAAVDHAADGLAGLERGRTGSGTPSAHLAAALAAEWISALLDAGRAGEARDGCSALLPRLSEQARPTRQLALLRLTVARALAAQDEQADTTQLLAQAAEDAAGSDVPDLEAVCRTALGALHERANQLDVALAELQVGVEAERRDRGRSRRFLAALAELPAEPVRGGKRRRERAAASPHRERRPPPATARPSLATARPPPCCPRSPAGTGSSRRARRSASTGARATAGPTRSVPAARAAGHLRRSAAKSRFERMLEEDPPVAPEPAAGDERPAELGRDAVEQLADRRSAHPQLAGRLGGIGRHRCATPQRQGPRRTGAPPGRRVRPGVRERTGIRHRVRGTTPVGRAVGLGSDARPGPRGAAPTAGAPWPHHRRRPQALDGFAPPGGAATVATRRAHGASDDDPPQRSDSAGGQERAGRGSSDQRHGSRRRPRHGDAHADGTGERPAHRRGSSDADDLDDESTTTRFAVTPDAPASAPAARRPRHGTTPERDRADEESRRPQGSRSGQRRPAEDPWATGRWAVRPDEQGEGESDPPANEAVEPSAAAPAGAGDDSDGWLAAALAELDRTLSGIGLGESARTEDRPQDNGCAVVVDIARDARRFAGPRAAAVVRSVADLVADRLPSGARSRFGDSDTLVDHRARVEPGRGHRLDAPHAARSAGRVRGCGGAPRRAAARGRARRGRTGGGADPAAADLSRAGARARERRPGPRSRGRPCRGGLRGPRAEVPGRGTGGPPGTWGRRPRPAGGRIGTRGATGSRQRLPVVALFGRGGPVE